MNLTKFVKGTNLVIYATFDIEKIKNYAIYYKPGDTWQIPFSIKINEIIKKELVKSKIGVKFTAIKTNQD